MFKLATVALSLLVLASSTQVWAGSDDSQLTPAHKSAPVMDLFTFTSSAAGESFSWELPNTLKTSSLVSHVSGQDFVVNVPSSNFPSGQIEFYNENNYGGLGDPTTNIVNFYSEQVYTGSESKPTFLTKGVTEVFTGTNYVSQGTCDATLGCAATLTISQIAAVPEPETYGMMLAGLGLMGFMVHRKKSV